MNICKLFSILPIFFLIACSNAYKQVREIDTSGPITFHEHLTYNFQKKASFEADEMHDWNSAKLYSEKALRALNGKNIYPQNINYWNISPKKIGKIRSGYFNLLSIYDEALAKSPENLAKAISSLDCWAEQEEEKWQTWDIDRCKKDFHSAMHYIYQILSDENNKENISEEQKKTGKETNVIIVKKNKKTLLMETIYFDFDDYVLSQISRNTLINFLENNKTDLSKYIILGHADTKGSNDYNLKLSLRRAETVRDILLNHGISEKDVSILGKGEGQLAVSTPDETKHPANRRAEVKILN